MAENRKAIAWGIRHDGICVVEDKGQHWVRLSFPILNEEDGDIDLRATGEAQAFELLAVLDRCLRLRGGE